MGGDRKIQNKTQVEEIMSLWLGLFYGWRMASQKIDKEGGDNK